MNDLETDWHVRRQEDGNKFEMNWDKRRGNRCAKKSLLIDGEVPTLSHLPLLPPSLLRLFTCLVRSRFRTRTQRVAATVFPFFYVS
uniref:Uncharacterized protein n=1 Tax=Caenorhabditis tropicalis TaxID=1561998 RepID=A0A1I7UEB9_9PELO